MRFVTALCVLILLGATVSIALADKYDPNEKPWHQDPTPTRATFPEDEGVNNSCPGQTMSCGDVIDPAALSPGGDLDWTNVTVAAGTLLTIDTSPPTDLGTDTYLEVYDSCTGSILVYDDDSGIGFYSTISNWPVPHAGTYYIKVRGYSPSSTGPYVLHVTCNTPNPPDPNDTCNPDYFLTRCSNQGVINGDMTWDNNNYDPGSGGCATGYPEAGVDVAYMINLNAGDVVDMTYNTPNFDAAFYVITDCSNPAGSCVIGADSGYDVESIHWVVGATGTYWIILDHYGTNTGKGPWMLQYNFQCPGLTGACCINGVCSITTQADCQGQGGHYYGDGTTCPQQDCQPVPVQETSWGQIKSIYH